MRHILMVPILFSCRPGPTCDSLQPEFVQYSEGEWKLFVVADNAVCGVLDGTVHCWGSMSVADGVVDGPVAGDGGWQDFCFVVDDGSGECTEFYPEFASVKLSGSFSDVSVSDTAVCFLGKDGVPNCYSPGLVSPIQAPSGPFIEMAVGTNDGCGIGTDGELQCWSLDGGGTPTAAPAGRFISLSVADDRYVIGEASDWWCAIEDTGDVTCWGSSTATRCDMLDAGPYDMVKVGRNFMCARNATSAMLDCVHHSGTAMESPAQRVDSFSIGYDSACAVSTGGGGVCWGDDTFGEVLTLGAIE